MSTLSITVGRKFTSIKRWVKARLHAIKRFAYKKPITFTGLFLTLLLLLLLASQAIRDSQQDQVIYTKPPKTVQVFRIGDSPRVTLTGQVEKANVLKIGAQTAGVVSSVSVKPGDRVVKGQKLVTIGSDYRGSNAASVQASLAQAQLNYAKDTYQDQKDLIAKQQELARTVSSNSQELRSIQTESIEGIRSQISYNQTVLDQINVSIDQLSQAPASSQSAQLLFSAQTAKIQLDSGIQQLQSSLRQLEYQDGSENPPQKLDELNRDITLKQLDLSLKALDFTFETSKLNAALANIQASLTMPSSPFAGVVERVFVYPGVQVNPGQALIVIKGNDESGTLVVALPQAYAANYNRLAEATIVSTQGNIPLPQPFVSTEPTDNNLYTLQFPLTTELVNLGQGDSVSVSLPIGNSGAGTTIPFVPLEAVYLDTTGGTVFVAENNQVASRAVETGLVLGDFVAVLEGISGGDAIILDRTVVTGQAIEVQ